MTAAERQEATPPGGPATIGGVIYQMLWCLLRLTRYEVRRIGTDQDEVINRAVLVLEPRAGGGDAREVRAANYTVTQLKSRSGSSTWSLQEVIKEILPDLLKAARIDEPAPVYEFVTDARRGDWGQVERFFQSLRNRDPGDDPSAQLDNTNLLRVGARPSKDSRSETFWAKSRYTERELFAKIVDELDTSPAAGQRREFERTVWHLLRHFKFTPSLSVAEMEQEIDLALSELVERTEEVPEKRRALLMRLAELARSGNSEVDLGSFLQGEGLRAVPSSHISALQARSRKEVMLRARRCGFDESQHVQERFTQELVAAVHDSQLVVLMGESGSGKSWHTHALSRKLSERGALVAHVESAGSARTTLNDALGSLWNTAKGQDSLLPYDRAARRLPGPPPSRVLIVDGVDDPDIARDLARTGIEHLGLRLVLAVGANASQSLCSLGTHRHQAIDVPGFSPSELDDYLIARRVPKSEAIPPEVRELLSLPMLARIYCDLAADTGWHPNNEYELLGEYWRHRLERNPAVLPTFDLPLLRDLARSLLDGCPYPWRARLINENAKHENSLARLQRAGWFVVHPTGDCSLWHDRLLNWLIADTLVDDVLIETRSVEELSTVLDESLRGELSAGGRWMAYVAGYALWLLVERGASEQIFASVLAALEQSPQPHTLYKELVPMLGERAVAGLLIRLDQLLAEHDYHSSLEIASCIARVASLEAVLKARSLLMSDSSEHHTVALHILRRRGDPSSLNRLWALHVQASATEARSIEYVRRMDALDAAIKHMPRWLLLKLSAAESDTACLSDLVYLLARFEDGGEAWRSLKMHLKTVVPKDKRRCLVRCITVFDDKSEVEFICGEQNQDTDWVGDTALAALTRLDPAIAIQGLARSELRHLALTRGWHLHRLLAAKPHETTVAVRALGARAAGYVLSLYASAENEIDSESMDEVLDFLELTLDRVLSQEKVNPNAGDVYQALSFVEKVCREDLIQILRARRGTALETKLVTYLLKIGPRSDVYVRLCDGQAFAALEMMGSEQAASVVEAGLDAATWHGRIDAAEHAHKHANPVILAKLRTLAGVTNDDANQRFVAYVATHALCFLEDWESMCRIAIQVGLAISPYVFEQRAGQPPLRGAYVEDLRARIDAGEFSPGVLLASGLTRDRSFIAPIAQALTDGTLGHDEVLSAAIALDVLEANDISIVAALSSHLGDETLRERFLGFLLAIGTPEALAVVFDELSLRFDAHLCRLLSQHGGWEPRAAELVWQHRTAAECSLSYGLAVPLLGHIRSPEARSYLEGLAYGMGTSLFGRSLRSEAIEGLSILDPTAAFRAAETALRDRMCDERADMPAVLMNLDAEQAKAVLLEIARTLDDEVVELAISDALATADVQADLLAMFASEAPNVRRVACVLAGRRPEPAAFQQQLRERALDVDERVAVAAMTALREHIRTQAVRDLVEAAAQATERSRRWILIDKAAKHARGTKELPPILRSTLAPFDGSLTPIEAERFNQVWRKGEEEYHRAIRSRAQGKDRSV